MKRIFSLALPFLFLLPFSIRSETTNEALARATAAVEAATPRAQADPSHPIFHVTSPAQWMNDPNGPIFYKGFYHLFYQLHPFSDSDGTKYWGHVRSRDLVKWEPLPIALWPSEEAGEAGVWSGCCTINGRGQPMIFYTSVAKNRSAFDHAEQWAAMGDDDLIHWRKSTNNPALSEALNGPVKIYDWRDPFIFRDGNKTFLVLGGHLEKQGRAAVNIYEALDPGLMKWTYRGVLFELPDPKTPTAECPNFFKLGNQWVLFVSPYGHVQYFVGDFDAKACRFHPRTQGTLDYGSFYAPNTMQLANGRRLVWGWINGFPGGRGWNGCLSLPRQLSLSRDRQLQQEPVPELKKLRGRGLEWKKPHVQNNLQTLTLPKTNTMEILAELEIPAAGNIELTFASSATSTRPISVMANRSELSVQNTKVPLQIKKDGKLSLHIFLDHSVMEVFANECVSITKVISPLGTNPVLELDAHGAPVEVSRMEAWPMDSIWPGINLSSR